jgi:small subunit ribosomal protein S20
MRNAVRKLRAVTDKEEALKQLPVVQKMLDKLAKTNIIHKNKAANLKSGLAKHIAQLG